MNKLREAEILLNQGANVGEACRKIGVTEQTYYRWRLVAELSLDISILKEVTEGNF